MPALSPEERFNLHNLAGLLLLTYPEFYNPSEWPPAVNITRSRLRDLHKDVDPSYYNSNKKFWHAKARAVRDVLKEAPYTHEGKA